MKRSIISLCVLALITVGVMCNAVEEKRNQNMSQMYITAREIFRKLESTRMKLQLMEI